MRLDLIKYNSEVIVCSAIYLAANKLQFPLPNQPEWWKLIIDDFQPVLEVSDEILSLYEMPKVYLHY